MKMKKGLLIGLLTTLMCGAVSFPVEVPVANQGCWGWRLAPPAIVPYSRKWPGKRFLLREPGQALRRDASSWHTESNTLSKRVDFAGLHRARKILGHKDPWANQLSDFDLGARQKTAEPTSLDEFLGFAADAGLDWTDQEKAGWKALVDKLSDAMKGLNLHVPNIDLVKTSGEEEFDSAYTRVRAVMLPESLTSLPTTDPRGAYFLLAHEVFHVLSRADSRLRDDLYALLGFKTVEGFEYPAELEERRISNPDAFEYLHTLTVQSGSESVDVLPVIQSLLPLNEVILLPDFFAALDIVLLSVDTSTGEAHRDGNGDLIKYNFGNTNWVPLMLRNSSLHHPPRGDPGRQLRDADGVAFGRCPAAGKSRRLPCQ